MSTGELNRVRGYANDPRPRDVAELLGGSPFVGYAYAYPHKTAYRALSRPRPLSEIWAEEDEQNLFLYVHVPFCAVRCGFCNLFTQKHPPSALPGLWLEALARQIDAVHEAVPEARFARWAIGGGTPTLLEAAQLEGVFELMAGKLGVDSVATPGSVETSPETCSADRLAVLEERGTTRVSIGIQSFFEAELRALGRPQAVALGEQALDRIRARAFGVLNIDLIYGIAGQTARSFVAAIERALSWAPEQFYLYPLYQRPLTGLGRRERSWDDQRLACLRAGRDHLCASGYEQVSMRMFRRIRSGGGECEGGSGGENPVYRCQADGMIGLGVGARSYTRTLHYSDDWAVGSAGVREIVGAWIERSEAQLRVAAHGIELDGDEQRRRWLIQSLLVREGLCSSAYRARFGAEVLDDFPDELGQLSAHGLIEHAGHRLRPTRAGLEWADAIAPWLYSEAVRRASGDFSLR